MSDDEIVQRLRDGGAMVVDVSLAKEEATGAELIIKGDSRSTPLATASRPQYLKVILEDHMPEILVAGVQ